MNQLLIYHLLIVNLLINNKAEQDESNNRMPSDSNYKYYNGEMVEGFKLDSLLQLII